MEVFARREAVLCGVDEVKNLLAHVLAGSDPAETTVEALDDGDSIAPKEIVLRITARYRRVRAVRDGGPRDARAVDRLGHRGARVR